MALMLLGVNHRSAPIEVRERLSVSETRVPELIRHLREIDGVAGATYISTCNRAEAVISCDDESVSKRIVDMLAHRASITPEELERHLYVLRNRDVIQHLFRVAAGLDSMIVGEPQIGGQVRLAYQLAVDNESLDSTLLRVFEQTLRVAKKVRTDTGIGESAVSVPFAGVELAKKIFGDLRGLTVLLIGAGEIAELTAQHLSGSGVNHVFVANRSYDKAQQLAEKFAGEAIQFDSLTTRLEACDIVIASTGAPHYLVTAPQVEAALSAKRRGHLFLIDLAVPRNIDPAIASVERAYVYNIDDLREVADSNLERRLERAQEADKIIESEVETFLRRLASQEAVPTIVELQTHVEEIRRTEIEKYLRKLGPISAEQRQAIDALTASIVNKILHHPIIRIKESAADDRNVADSMRETVRRLFGLR